MNDLVDALELDSRASFYAVLDGDTDPSLTQLVRLARALKLTSIEELFGDFGSKNLIG